MLMLAESSYSYAYLGLKSYKFTDSDRSFMKLSAFFSSKLYYDKVVKASLLAF